MKEVNKLLQAQFAIMCATGRLFKSEITGQEVWDAYIAAFHREDDPTFRDPESSTHNCNHCNNFIRRYGNVVAIDENFNIITLFDVLPEEEYEASMDRMSKMLRKAPIANIFFETFQELNGLPYESCNKNQEVYRLGIDKNPKRYTEAEANMYPGVVKKNETRTFHHMYLDLPAKFVTTTSESIESIQGRYRSNKEVFLRAMTEIPLDTLQLVKDLISQGSLLDGDTHVGKVETMIDFKKHFDEISTAKRDKWAWIASYKLAIAKFKNELIGVLCSELAEGEELNKACQSWNKRVDPANYMKAVAPITETHKKNAQKFVEENGYIESFDRRLAVLDDIKVNEIKHMNIGEGVVKAGSIFDDVKPTKTSRHKRNEFEGIEEVGIEKFMKDILPMCTSVEAYLENRLEGNLVTMTTSNEEDCKQMFKWTNPYSWTYKGNLAGKSMIKQAVKAQGGVVDGVLNFRLAWNDGTNDESDLDAWAQEPTNEQIGYSTNYRAGKQPGRSPLSGQLDVDNTSPGGKLAVENITWNNLSKMREGVYKLWVNQYAADGSKGFKAEVEFNGETYEYSYDKNMRTGTNVMVAEVILKNGEFTIEHKLPSTSSSKEIYGLETKKFHKVNLMCLSPNHWGENKVGNKHYFFMLDKCKVDTAIRSFHSENLEPELAQHRKVLEVLGAVNMLEPQDKALSGLGFNATVKDEVILKLKGNFKRTIKVKF